MVKPTVELYGTSCCHLCEEAEAVLREAGVAAQHNDIADDDGLLENTAYAFRYCGAPTAARSSAGRSMPRRWRNS